MSLSNMSSAKKWAICSVIIFLITYVIYSRMMDEDALAVSQETNTSQGDLLSSTVMVSAEKGNLFYRVKQGDGWSESVSLSDGLSNSATPSLAKDGDGNLWVVWSEASQKGAELRYRVFLKSTNEWGSINTVNTGFAHNSTPALIADNGGKLWVFWAAVDGNDDEIFYSQMEAGVWQPPKRVAPNNEVPDISPIASLSVDGQLEVDWQTFDHETFKYKNTAARWNDGEWQLLGFRTINPLKTSKRLSSTSVFEGG